MLSQKGRRIFESESLSGYSSVILNYSRHSFVFKTDLLDLSKNLTFFPALFKVNDATDRSLHRNNIFLFSHRYDANYSVREERAKMVTNYNVA
jgi:hypothetical protein